jgi:hypothetical protein
MFEFLKAEKIIFNFWKFLLLLKLVTNRIRQSKEILVEFSSKKVIINIYLHLSYKLFFKNDLAGSEHVYSLKN